MEFKIYLLNQETRNQKVYYTTDLITHFVPQTQSFAQNKQDWSNRRSRPHAYTFNESYSISQNGKKSLTFSMTRQVMLNDNWQENPFVQNIHSGSQLLLEDAYGNQTVFFVKSIKYSFSSVNVTYEYTCEDFFSYSTTRQQAGYEIENDSTSDDFIGAKTLDWWAHKIVEECLIKYNYIPLATGLTQTDGSILKESYPNNEDFADYYTTITFSCSNSSANAALIDLAGRLDMQLRVYEHLEADGTLSGKFWFEPMKNELRDSGLVYSPKTSISSFALTHDSASLTTVLNVSGPTYDDDLITLIPTITPFFFRVFSSTSWDHSNFAEHGYSDLLKTQQINLSWVLVGDDLKKQLLTEQEQESNQEYAVFGLEDEDLAILQSTIALYPRIDFTGSVFSYRNAEGVWQTSPTGDSKWFLRPYNEDKTITKHPADCYQDGQLLADRYVLIIYLGRNWDSTQTYTLNICTGFYDNFTQEDYDFAQAADRCPWLENKLIDLSYFKDSNIISASEYRDALNLIYNKLRITNGHLLCYSNAYYTALHNKTQILAEITNDLDSLGAACQAAIVSPLEQDGTVKDASYFTSAYNNFFATTTRRTELMSRNNSLTSYFNKYWNAQQRFLKNIYLFRKFWDSKVTVDGDGIYNYILTLPKPKTWDESCDYYSFSDSTTVPIALGSDFQQYNTDTASNSYGSPFVDVYIKQDDNYLKATIVDASNYTNYLEKYAPTEKEVTLTTNNYQADETYYQKVLILHGDNISDTSDNCTWYPQVSEDYIWSAQTSSRGFSGGWLLVAADKYEQAKTSKDLASFLGDDFQNHLVNIIKCVSSTDCAYNITFAMQQVQLIGSDSSCELLQGYIDNTLKLLPIIYSSATKLYTCVDAHFADGINNSYQSELSVQEISLVDLINNQLNKNPDNLQSYYVRDGLIYRKVGDCQGAVKTILDTLQETNRQTEGVQKKYKENFPIDTYYWKGVYSSFNSSDTAEDSYWQLYSKINQKITLKEVKESDNTQYLPVSFVTADNVGNYYHYYDRSWTTGWLIAATLYNPIVGGSLLAWYLSQSSAYSNDTTLSTTQDIWGQEITVFTGYETGSALDEYKGKVYPIRFTPNAKGPRVIRSTNPENFFVKILYSGIDAKDYKYYAYGGLFQDLAFTWDDFFDSDVTNYHKQKAIGTYGVDLANEIYFVDTTWRAINNTINDPVVSTGTYALFNCDNESPQTAKQECLTWPSDLNSDQGGSAAVYYPWVNYFENLSTSKLDWKKTDHHSVIDLLSQNFNDEIVWTADSEDSYRYIGTYKGQTKKVRVLQQNKYSYVHPGLNATACIRRYIETAQVYRDYYSLCDWTSTDYPTFVKGYYVTKEPYRAPTKFALTGINYVTKDTHTPVLTIEQAKLNNKYVYYNVFQTSQESFSKNLSNFENITVYKHSLVVNSNQRSETIGEAQIISIQDLDWGDGTDLTVKVHLGEDTLDLDITQSLQGLDFAMLNNGTFWYNYRDDDKHALCQSHAAAIEAELTQYWSSAYTASKYCEYYLPENWVRYTNQKDNQMFDNLFQMSNASGLLEIQNTLIPIVYIYAPNGQNQQPRYQWTHVGDTSRQVSWDDEVEISASAVVTSNPALQAAFNTLGEQPSQFSVEKIGNTVYYYADDGMNGMKWPDFLQKYTAKSYGSYSGIYVLAYRKLMKYTDQTIDQYEQYKTKQANIWKEIYNRFDNIILEKSYTNSDATTADELYTAAKYQLLDTTVPERSYSISIIDWHNIKGYIGQDLHVGDPIRLDYTQFYDGNDYITKSLAQLLFITDIKYTLRDASNLSITVNNIKYSDKLINRLVSLMH